MGAVQVRLNASDPIPVWAADTRVGWSMGTVGAIAEFIRLPDEPARQDVTAQLAEVTTDRGGLRLAPPVGTRLVAYETPAGPHGHWNHTLALCLPADRARGAARSTITVLGPDREALREVDRDAVLVDLGLGTATVDVCVRTDDAGLLERLTAAAGTAVFADPHLVAAIVSVGPHRVFTGACGRVEVYAAIPTPDGRSPDGPHTHLLPRLLRPGRTHRATAPIPAGWLPSAAMYPPHPAVDRTGRPREFDRACHDEVTALLEAFSDPEQLRLKKATWQAIRSGSPLPEPGDPPGRAAVSVALRQIAALHPEHVAAATTHSARTMPDDLLDPDGDPHGDPARPAPV